MELIVTYVLAVGLIMIWLFKEKTRPKKIFVIEDNESDRMLLRMNLKLKNCVIEYFDSCESFISEIMFKGRPDGVLCDYYLAGRTKGDELIKFCKNNGIESLLVTGFEGEILGIDESQILRKTANETYYRAIEKWAERVIV